VTDGYEGLRVCTAGMRVGVTGEVADGLKGIPCWRTHPLRQSASQLLQCCRMQFQHCRGLVITRPCLWCQCSNFLPEERLQMLLMRADQLHCAHMPAENIRCPCCGCMAWAPVVSLALTVVVVSHLPSLLPLPPSSWCSASSASDLKAPLAAHR
jgi:hypothetical protein